MPLRVYSELAITKTDFAEEHFSNFNVPANIRPGAGGLFSYQKKILILNGSFVSLSSSDTGWSYRSDYPTDGFLVAIPQRSSTEWYSGREKLVIDYGKALVLDCLRVNGATFSSGSQNYNAFVPYGEMVEHLSMLIGFPVVKRLKFDTEKVPSKEVITLLENLCSTILAGVAGSGPLLTVPVVMANLQQALRGVLFHGFLHNYSELLSSLKAPIPTPRSIKAAISYIYSNSTNAITLTEIAKHAGISLRSLQLGFRKYKGVTPMMFLRMVRLEQVKAELSNPLSRECPKKMALRFGFFNFYLFAKYYYQKYGECPRTTATNARRF